MAKTPIDVICARAQKKKEKMGYRLEGVNIWNHLSNWPHYSYLWSGVKADWLGRVLYTLCFPQALMLKLHPQCDGVWRWGFGR